MNTKILGFVLMLSFIGSPVLAQDEELLIEEPAASTQEDIFSGDFFSDLDSFLEENVEETGADEALMNDEPTQPMSNEVLLDNNPSEVLQSSANQTSGSLPSSAEVTLTVTNVSQDNANALQSGARPGDVLRYEVSLSSAVEDVVNFVPRINVSAIESVVEFTNTGFGVRENGSIIYPSYSHQAPCIQAFTFFVRVLEDCSDLKTLNVSADQAGTAAVPLNCGLAQTGPSQTWFLLAGLMMLVLTFMFGMFGRRLSR